MSKSFIGKLVAGITFLVLFAIMVANNVFRLFDFIPYGSEVTFFGAFIVWGIVHLIMTPIRIL